MHVPKQLWATMRKFQIMFCFGKGIPHKTLMQIKIQLCIIFIAPFAKCILNRHIMKHSCAIAS